MFGDSKETSNLKIKSLEPLEEDKKPCTEKSTRIVPIEQRESFKVEEEKDFSDYEDSESLFEEREFFKFNRSYLTELDEGENSKQRMKNRHGHKDTHLPQTTTKDAEFTICNSE